MSVSKIIFALIQKSLKNIVWNVPSKDNIIKVLAMCTNFESLETIDLKSTFIKLFMNNEIKEVVKILKLKLPYIKTINLE